MKEPKDFYKDLIPTVEADYLVTGLNHVTTYIEKGGLSGIIESCVYNWIHRFPSGELESMDEVWTYIERESHSIDMLDLDLELVYPSKVYDTVKEVLMATLRYILNKKLSKHLYNKYDTSTKR